MASTEFFESGLNKWLSTDKPARADFIRDNQIIDEKVLWKEDFKDNYDADSTVKQAGGISNFVDGKVAGTVKQGLDDAVEQLRATSMLKEDYAFDATASISGIEDNAELHINSVYSHTGATYDVRFIVPETYKNGMPIFIDDQLVTVKDQTGEAIEFDVKPGIPAVLTRKESEAFFKIGGGGQLGYEVVGSAVQPSPKKGKVTIWVKTEKPMNKNIPWITAQNAYNPGAAQEGCVVITGNFNGQQGYAGMKDGKYGQHWFQPVKAAQVVNGVLAPRAMQIWDGSKWGGAFPANYIVFENGVMKQGHYILKGSNWGQGWDSEYGTFWVRSAGYMYNSYGIGAYLNPAIDVTIYSTCKWTVSAANGEIKYSGLTTSPGGTTFNGVCKDGAGTFTADISNLRGSYYFAIATQASGNNSDPNYNANISVSYLEFS